MMVRFKSGGQPVNVQKVMQQSECRALATLLNLAPTLSFHPRVGCNSTFPKEWAEYRYGPPNKVDL